MIFAIDEVRDEFNAKCRMRWQKPTKKLGELLLSNHDENLNCMACTKWFETRQVSMKVLYYSNQYYLLHLRDIFAYMLRVFEEAQLRIIANLINMLRSQHDYATRVGHDAIWLLSKRLRPFLNKLIASLNKVFLDSGSSKIEQLARVDERRQLELVLIPDPVGQGGG